MKRTFKNMTKEELKIFVYFLMASRKGNRGLRNVFQTELATHAKKKYNRSGKQEKLNNNRRRLSNDIKNIKNAREFSLFRANLKMRNNLINRVLKYGTKNHLQDLGYYFYQKGDRNLGHRIFSAKPVNHNV